MATLFCFVACKNSSSDSGDSSENSGGTLQPAPNGSSDSGDSQGWQYSIGYSLGDPPAENLSFEKLGLDVSAKEDSEGIYLEFDYPESKDYWTTRVYVEGLGTIAEEVQDLDTTKTKGCFFYPFVDAGKEYTIRFVSFANEKKDENDFVIDGDTVLAWFETKVKAGSKSKGEVRLTSKGEIFVDKKGNFKFTKRPTFQNEHLLGNDWAVNMGLVEGVSWEHGAERKTKWNSAEIPQKAITELYNLYDAEYTIWGNPIVIDFICVRPVKSYEHNGKTYNYQWESFVRDIFYPQKIITFEDIDIDNPSQVSKIYGTWKRSDAWGDNGSYKYTETLIISANEIKLKPEGITDEPPSWKSLSDYLESKIWDEYGQECESHRQLKFFEDSDLGRLQVITSYIDSKGKSQEGTDVYIKQ